MHGRHVGLRARACVSTTSVAIPQTRVPLVEAAKLEGPNCGGTSGTLGEKVNAPLLGHSPVVATVQGNTFASVSDVAMAYFWVHYSVMYDNVYFLINFVAHQYATMLSLNNPCAIFLLHRCCVVILTFSLSFTVSLFMSTCPPLNFIVII